MADVLVVNGFDTNQQFSAGGYGQSQDMSSPSAEQMEFVINSQSFREGLQDMVAEQIGTTSPSRLPYGGRVFGPVTPVGDIHGADTLNYTKGEKVVRGKLASCYRLADINGWSHGLDGYITVRLAADNNVLIAPHGVMYDEVTASSLVKVDVSGNVLDVGSTTLGIDASAVALHTAVYGCNQDLRCVVHMSSPAAVSVSTMKCGLLPLCHEAMIVGDVAYTEYAASPADDENIRQALTSGAKVVFLRNYGVLIVGETIEEAFLTTVNVMTAIDTQLNLVPFGLSNLHLPSDESRKEAYRMARQLPAGVSTTRQWGYGELEFESFMRQLDNAGYRTGHVYRDSATSQRRGRSSSEADVTSKKLSLANDGRESQNSMRRGGSRCDWVVTPNVYHREESDEQASSAHKGTRWISDTSTEEQWVSDTGKGRSTPSGRLSVDANKFAPQGCNPNELRNKVKEIRKEYFEDTITAGPQSTILEGVTWEEAQRIKEGQAVRGIDNVLVTAASRGIIQREHQPRALFYKNYAQVNPFGQVTKDDLDAYRREVDRKTKQRRAGGYLSADSELDEPSILHDNRPMSAPPPQLSFNITRPIDIDDDVFQSGARRAQDVTPRYSDQQPPVTRSVEPPVAAQPQTVKPQSPPATVESPTARQEPTPVAAEPPRAKPEPQPEPPKPAVAAGDLQRTQSARYPPEKRPETVEEFKRNVKKSKSLRHSRKHAPESEALSPEAAGAGAGAGASKEGSMGRDTPSEGGTLQRKKKRGFRFPSFSKKKDKDKENA